jgi:hypothetical protein
LHYPESILKLLKIHLVGYNRIDIQNVF